MAARLTDEQIKYILASPYSSQVVAKETDITGGTVRYIRRKNGYKIIHSGYRPSTLDGEPVDLEAFDMPIPKTRQDREVKNDSDVIHNFFCGRLV
jgi:hypothetical protein